MSQTLKSVYTIRLITSRATPLKWESIEVIAKNIDQGFVVLWQHHAIFTGVIEAGQVHWLNEVKPVSDSSHFVRLRAFNGSKEYHFWKSGQHIKGRQRIDTEGGTQEAVDTRMKLRSVIGKPLQKAHSELVSDELVVVTRNYIGYDETTNQAGYVDSRFVKFQPFKTNNS